MARTPMVSFLPLLFLPRSLAPSPQPLPVPFSPVQDAVDAIARGEVIIVVDAEDRENEGDFICSAEKATPETINFILSGRGEFCVPLLPEVARRLELCPIVDTNTAPLDRIFDADRPSQRQDRDHRGRALPHGARDGRSRRARLATSSAPATSIRCWPKKAAFFAGPGTPKLPSICAAWRASRRSACLCEILDDAGNRATRDQLQAIAKKHKLQNHLDRAAHRPPPRQRKARQPPGPGAAADGEVRRLHDHRLRGEIRVAEPDRARQRGARQRRRPARPAALLLLHRRPPRLASAATAAANCRWRWRW